MSPRMHRALVHLFLSIVVCNGATMLLWVSPRYLLSSPALPLCAFGERPGEAGVRLLGLTRYNFSPIDPRPKQEGPACPSSTTHSCQPMNFGFLNR